jgi:hypothetical protein
MKSYAPSQPVRRDLIDPRSAAAPAAAPSRKVLLNDSRSTRRRA